MAKFDVQQLRAGGPIEEHCEILSCPFGHYIRGDDPEWCPDCQATVQDIWAGASGQWEELGIVVQEDASRISDPIVGMTRELLYGRNDDSWTGGDNLYSGHDNNKSAAEVA